LIVSASRRSDLPALFAPWLAGKIEEGRVEVANPFNPSSVRLVDLRPTPTGSMEALVLWTRNPGPLLPWVGEWEERGIRSLWLVTVTGYPSRLEPNAPPVDEAIEALACLAGIIGRERISWRYDPVFTSRNLCMDPSFHQANFTRLAKRINKHAGRAVISIYDAYARASQRLKKASVDFEGGWALESCRSIARNAAAYDLPLQSCCEELGGLGIKAAGCIDGELLDSLWGLGVTGKKDKHQRPLCLCAPSVDIGRYGTCTHGCLYCYATRRETSAKEPALD